MNQIKTAVIMAAGLGTRFGNMVRTMPKGFIEVGGMPMVIRSIETLISCGIDKIIVGTGYHKESYEKLAEKYPQIQCCFSERYAETNSMYTLYNSREAIGNDSFILLESDLVFEKKAITALLDSEWENIMLVSPVTKFQDQYYIECNEDNVLFRCSVNGHEVNAIGELVGIHKISNKFYKKMCSDYSLKLETNLKLGYEFELQVMSQDVMPIYVLKIDGLKWYEIDDEADRAYAEKHIIQYL